MWIVAWRPIRHAMTIKWSRWHTEKASHMSLRRPRRRANRYCRRGGLPNRLLASNIQPLHNEVVARCGRASAGGIMYLRVKHIDV